MESEWSNSQRTPNLDPTERLIQFFVSLQQLKCILRWHFFFKQWGSLKGWATGVWHRGQTTVVQCGVMSCRGLTCWASSSCLTRMTNHRVLAETVSEYIVFLLLVRLKISLHILLPLLSSELAQCPVGYSIYRNTATDALPSQNYLFICKKSVSVSVLDMVP